MNKKFRLLGRLILFTLPFSVFVAVYAITDPYMVLYDYSNYNKNYYINKNRDYISTEMFMINSKKYDYDSFIFGSSTALYLPPSIWAEYIDTENEIFSFDASGERLEGIWSKVKYLDNSGVEIKNALISLETITFTNFVNNIAIYMKHYEVFPSSKLNFQYLSFLNFCDLRFLVALIHYKITGEFHSYMDQFLVFEKYEYNSITNEFCNSGIIEELKKDSIHYYEKRLNRFPQQSGYSVEETEKITSDHIEMLNEINNIFTRHKTNLRVIICPTFNQRKFNQNDLNVLKSIFGEQHVFDFTGINRFTNNKSMYYDEFHFKKYLGKELLDSVYSNHPVKLDDRQPQFRLGTIEEKVNDVFEKF